MFLEDDGEAELRELSREECFQLLGTVGVGRVAVAAEGEAPLVVPVNFVLDDQDVVFRSSGGAKLDLLHGRPISFQADLVDLGHRSGWSVLMRGTAREIPGAEAAHLRVQPWVGQGTRWVRITAVDITGRRIELPEVRQDERGYL